MIHTNRYGIIMYLSIIIIKKNMHSECFHFTLQDTCISISNYVCSELFEVHTGNVICIVMVTDKHIV